MSCVPIGKAKRWKGKKEGKKVSGTVYSSLNNVGGSVTESLTNATATAFAGQTTATAWAFADHQGSVNTWGIREAGNWNLSHHRTTEFGQPVGGVYSESAAGLFLSVETALPVIWAGHRLDIDTHLADMQARWRDMNSGVFLSEDPSGYAAGDSNLYRYAFNSPGNAVDPDGRIAESVWDGASVLIGAGSLYLSIRSGDVTGATIDTIGLFLDATALAIPLLPGGAGIAIRGYRLANAAADAARAVEAARNVANITRSVVRTADLGVQIASTAVALDRGDAFGATLGVFGLGIRGFQAAPAFGRLLNRLPERRGVLSLFGDNARKEAGGRYLFRADDNYSGGSVGRALGAEADGADIQTFADHVLRNESRMTSRFTSFTTETGAAARFSKATDLRNLSKARLDQLKELEAAGTIRIHTAESVYDAMRAGPKKMRNEASAVRDAMRRNAEVLIEGKIPEGILRSVK